MRYIQASTSFRRKNIDSAAYYNRKALALAGSISNDRLYFKAWFDKISLMKETELPNATLDTLMAAFRHPLLSKNKKYIYQINFELGILNRKLANFDKSLSYMLAALKLAQEMSDSSKMMRSYNGIANVYRTMGEEHKSIPDLKKAVEYYDKALSVKTSEGRSMLINNKGSAYFQIASVKFDTSALGTAIRNFIVAKELREAARDSTYLADSYNNLAGAYHLLAKNGLPQFFARAKEYYTEAIKLSRVYNPSQYYTNVSNYGGNLLEMGKYQGRKDLLREAVDSNSRALQMSEDAQDIVTTLYSIGNLARTYEALGDLTNAMKFYHQSEALYESFLKQENKRLAEELAVKYETELKETENRNLRQQSELKEEVIKRKSNTITVMIAGSAILLVLIIVALYSRQMIRMQKRETERQKLLIEEKQKEILDSINYSKRLQSAAIPSLEYFRSVLPSTFIFYQPKDIVAGDFYWIHPVSEQKAAGGNDRVLVAAADCTGHGVPGALVSIVCLNALNRCVEEFSLTDPSRILDKSAEIIQHSFRQSENNVKDGMDIALCLLDHKNGKGYFAGANNPLWILRNGSIIGIEADRQPVGQQPDPKPFIQREFEMHTGDVLFLFSDGYADQFGGKDGKKMKSKKFREMLINAKTNDLNKLENIIRESFNTWKGNLAQVDDILVIGIKV